MREKLAEIFGVVLRGWDKLLCFEVLYKTAGFGILFPFLQSQMEKLPKLAGIPYLGPQNLGLILRSPLALLLAAGLLLLLAFYLLFEIIVLFLYCESGWQRRDLTFLGLWRESLLRTASLFRMKRAGVLLLFPPLLLSAFSLSSGWLQNIRLPEFVLDYIRAAPLLTLLYAGVVLLCNLILFRYLFGFPAMFLAGASFLDSWRESSRLLRKKNLRIFGMLLCFAAVFTAVLAFAAAAAVLLLAGYTRAFYPLAQAHAQFQFYFIAFQRAGTIAAATLASVFLCAVTVVLYHACRQEKRPSAVPGKKTGFIGILKRTAFALFTLVFLIFASESEMGGPFPRLLWENPQIVAHRAGGFFAPENTVAALEQAISDGADQAEIDVQQLGDGTLIVLHDTNFQRTTGSNGQVWDASYADVRSLEAGSHFSPTFTGEPIPTLEEMLTAAKGRIGLMIELKSTGHETKLVESTLELIQKHGMRQQCSIASMDLNILARTKALMPEMQTVYICALLVSDRYDLPNVDCYSVETSSLSAGMVAQIHAEGRMVYGWTANSTKTLAKLLYCEVDGLVTDNIILAEYCIENNGENLLLDAVTGLFF